MTAEALGMSYGGCREVRLPGPVCSLTPTDTLVLWMPVATPSVVEIRLDGRVVPTASLQTKAAAEGWRWELPGSSAAATLEVQHEASVWRLELEPWRAPPWWDAVQEDLQQSDFQAARQVLDAHLERSPDAGPALSMAGLIALQVDGDVETALQRLDAAGADHARQERRLSQVEDGTRAVYLLLELGDYRFSEVRRRLRELGRQGDDPAEALYYLDYYRGLLAQRVGDLRSALAHLSDAAVHAERAAMVTEERTVQQVLGGVLAELGRFEEATALYEHLQSSPESEALPEKSCLRVQQLNNQAWASLLTLEAGGRPHDPPRSLLQRALGDLQTGAGLLCMDAEAEEANLRLNLALAALHDGDVAAARDSLDRFDQHAQAEATTLPALQTLWRQELEARLALRRGDAVTALRLFDQLALAEPAAFPATRWRAQVGRARALEALERPDEAIEALEQAETLLDAESLDVPIHAGRDTFLSGRERAARLQVRLLLEADEPRRAFEAARRNRARFLLGLRWADRLAGLSAADQERWDEALAAYQRRRAELDAEAADDWRLPADQLAVVRAARSRQARDLAGLLDRALAILGTAAPRLAPLRADELVLLYHPLTEDEWIAFAATAQGIEVHRLADPRASLDDPQRLARVLFEPVQTQLRAARRLRLLPYGQLRQVDLHALPFDGEVLLAQAPVVYGLDLDPRQLPQSKHRALLVADPLDDLPAARQEADSVRDALQTSRMAWQIDRLEGASAQAHEVRQQLEGALLFHYAGHGRFAGWSSALPLADGGRLTVGDILALERAPRHVVLSGCETGRAATASAVETIGLAQAFLAAGSHSVLAAVRPVEDRAAADLVEAWYRWPEFLDSISEEVTADAPDFRDPAAVLQGVQLAWRSREATADWASFRFFEP